MKLIQKSAICILMGLSGSAFAAGNSTATILSTALVLDSCLVVATPIVFGTYTASTDTDAGGTIVATCTLNTAYTIKVDAGGGTGATFASRKMAGLPAGTLNYSIYTNAARSTVWGDGTGGSQTVAGAGIGLPQILQTYGRIPASQNVPAGAYTDSVTVTLTY